MSSNRNYCLVPMCDSTSVKTPNKLFFAVPSEEPDRSRWFNAMRRDLKDKPLSSKGKFRVCEDHFDLDKDVLNMGMVRFSIENGYRRPPAQYRPGLVPHKFDCQSTARLLTGPPEKRRKSRAVEKLNAKRTLSDLFHESEPILSATEDDNIQEMEENFSRLLIETSTQTEPQVSHKSVQARPNFRNKGIQTMMKKDTSDAATDTADMKLKNFSAVLPSLSSLSPHRSVASSTSSSSYSPPSSSVSSSLSSSYRTMKNQEMSLTCSLYNIERNPKLYLGITKEFFFVISTLCEFSSLSSRDIYLTLKKIRTDDVFERLADDFGMSSSNASKVFNKTLISIAPLLSQLVFMPERKMIARKLPIGFRKNFSKTVAIIDCFEVQIEKPGDPVKQAMTWSQYYGCNTIKFLVSCVPNGFINFISPGFTGRISDPDIVKESGFLEILTPGDSIMADRGFKNLSGILNDYRVTLVRPPSVAKNAILSKEDALSAKRIASLRVHIERVIGRIREFKILKPRSTVDNNLIPYLDIIATCVAGLVNLQSVIL